MPEFLPFSSLFEPAAIPAWGALVVLIVQFGKRFVPGIPDTGRGVLYVVAAVCAGLLALAVVDRGTGVGDVEAIKNLVLLWIGFVSTSVGLFELGSKTARVVTGSTDPSGPDAG